MVEHARILRIVVASPGDVTAERDVVSAILEELNKSICLDRGLRLEALRWETDAYPGFDPGGPQGLIDPILRIEDGDLLVGIFWKRFGTPVEDARSGTEHEIRRAYAAWKQSGRPQLMIYFNQKACTPQSKEETDQWGQVLEFRREFPKEGLWWPYKGVSNFEKLLRRHLTNYLLATFPGGPQGSNPRSGAISREPRAASGTGDDYFAVQRQIIDEHTRTFVGRNQAQSALESFLQKNKRGYFVVYGGPGQGKTALACRFIKSGGYVHHFVSRTGGRADPRLILRSLLSQLARSQDSGIALPDSVAELTKAFEETLYGAAGRGERVVVVIDALDELTESGTDPPWLPVDGLPDGVFFVITSRSGPHLDRLLERLFATPRQILELGPLDSAAMSDILRTRKPDITPAEMQRIAEAAQGNPLYLRAAADDLVSHPRFSPQDLPETIEGFFRKATSTLRVGNAVLGEVMGLLSVVRKPLSIRELGEITGRQQREIFDGGIRPIEQFLLKTSEGYTFYHSRFHEFVTRTILYDDELRAAHKRFTVWLERPEHRVDDYRFNSLAWHLFESGAHQQLLETIREDFLAEKLSRFGYAVLEDVELLTRSLLAQGDPSLVERCVSIVESLRQIAGGDIIPSVAGAVQPWRSGPDVFRTHRIEPPLVRVPELDVWAAVLPKAAVAADFFEMVAMGDRLVVAIGDAPAVGLRSAFVARFIGNLFHELVARSGRLSLGQILNRIDATIRDYDYFKRISMQCADIDPSRGIVRIANAGHPWPVHYSARRGKCDILPLGGKLLHSSTSASGGAGEFPEYALTLGPGDVLTLVTDGLTEDHVFAGEPYGYRFTGIIEARASQGARAIGDGILGDWKAHPRELDMGDDISIIVIAAGAMVGKASS